MRSSRSLATDERAIEGLPIRLVIALVVGVASLAVMMQMLGGLGDPGSTEVDVDASDDLVAGLDGVGSSSPETATVEVVDDQGVPVENVQVIIESGTAEIEDGPIQLGLSGGSSATLQLCDADSCNSQDGGSSSTARAAISFRSNQDKGTIKFDIVTPSDSDYQDEKGNSEVTVMK